MNEAEFIALAEEHQGTVVAILEAQGEQSAAALLVEAEMAYIYTGFDNWNGGSDVFEVQLVVSPKTLPSYSEPVLDSISKALTPVLHGLDRIIIGNVVVVPRPVGKHWREQRSVDAVHNQAAVAKLPASAPERHGMKFRSSAEAALFDVLEQVQARLPSSDTILITPLPLVWTGRHRWEPDFLVCYRGRVGVIEVDDPTHANRYAADKSRDQILEEHGIALVRRIAVEDVQRADEVLAFVRSFLERLGSRPAGY